MTIQTEKQRPIFKDNQWTQVQYDYDGNKTLGRRVVNLTEEQVMEDYPSLFEKPALVDIDLTAALRDYTLSQEDGVTLLMTYKNTVSAWIKNDFFLESTFTRPQISIGVNEINLLEAILNQDTNEETNPLYGQTTLITLLSGFVAYLKTMVKE